VPLPHPACSTAAVQSARNCCRNATSCTFLYASFYSFCNIHTICMTLGFCGLKSSSLPGVCSLCDVVCMCSFHILLYSFQHVTGFDGKVAKDVTVRISVSADCTSRSVDRRNILFLHSGLVSVISSISTHFSTPVFFSANHSKPWHIQCFNIADRDRKNFEPVTTPPSVYHIMQQLGLIKKSVIIFSSGEVDGFFNLLQVNGMK